MLNETIELLYYCKVKAKKFVLESSESLKSKISSFHCPPTIEKMDKTIDYILANSCSVSRFGDGEFALMYGRHSIGFQKENEMLRNRLLQVLTVSIEDHIVCLPPVFSDLSYLRVESKSIQTNFLKRYKYSIYKSIDFNRKYYDSFFTRPYMMFNDKSQCAKIFNKIKKLWSGKDLLIIEGTETRFGIGNDLINNANSVIRVLCPPENAFEKYDKILNESIKYGFNRLVLLALGPTATVLSYDLCRSGIWAVDIGHLDIEYEWFLQNAENKVVIKEKYVNEVKGGNFVAESTNEGYKSQIVSTI